MPFYEYECSACKYYTEVLQKISEPPLRKCPSCGKQALKRLVSAPVFRLKGSGWYETDFKSDKEQKRNLVGEVEKETKEVKEAKDGETKSPEAKTSEAPAKSEAKPVESKPKPSKASASKASPKPVAKAKPAAKKKAQRR